MPLALCSAQYASMALVSPDSRKAPLIPAMLHYHCPAEAKLTRSFSFSGYTPYVLKELADEIVGSRRFERMASAQANTAKMIQLGEAAVEELRMKRVRSHGGDRCVKTENTSPSKRDSSGSEWADWLAEETFNSEFEIAMKSQVKAAASPFPMLSGKGSARAKEDIVVKEKKLQGLKPPTSPTSSKGSAETTEGTVQVKNQVTTSDSTACEEDLWENFTTVMIRNLPAELSQSQLLRQLDSDGFYYDYDLVYLPHNFSNGTNKGFAFVNFKTTSAALRLVEMWHGGWKKWNGSHFAARGSLNLRPASVQGVDANLRQWLGPKGRRIRNPKFKPYVVAQHVEQVQAILAESDQ